MEDELPFHFSNLPFHSEHIRKAKYAKNHFQQNRYSGFESHVMRKESISGDVPSRVRVLGRVIRHYSDSAEY